MRYVKQSVCSLEKCYALSTLVVQGKQHLLVAGEKHAPCYLLDLEGNLIDTVWEEPGGVMTMVAIPDRDGKAGLCKVCRTRKMGDHNYS